MKPFIVKYSWEKINCPSQNDDYKKIEKNNLTISLSVFYTKKEKNTPCLHFEASFKAGKQVILIIPNGEEFYYIAVKKLPVLSRKITFLLSKLPSSFRTKYKLDSHKNVCKNKDFCDVIMSSEETKILDFNHSKIW